MGVGCSVQFIPADDNDLDDRLRKAPDKAKALQDLIDGAIPWEPVQQSDAESFGFGIRQLSDMGNAERFIARCGHDAKYCPAWKNWLLWDGRRWAVDQRLRVEKLAKETVRAIPREADGNGFVEGA